MKPHERYVRDRDLLDCIKRTSQEVHAFIDQFGNCLDVKNLTIPNISDVKTITKGTNQRGPLSVLRYTDTPIVYIPESGMVGNSVNIDKIVCDINDPTIDAQKFLIDFYCIREGVISANRERYFPNTNETRALADIALEKIQYYNTRQSARKKSELKSYDLVAECVGLKTMFYYQGVEIMRLGEEIDTLFLSMLAIPLTATFMHDRSDFFNTRETYTFFLDKLVSLFPKLVPGYSDRHLNYARLFSNRLEQGTYISEYMSGGFAPYLVLSPNSPIPLANARYYQKDPMYFYKHDLTPPGYKKGRYKQNKEDKAPKVQTRRYKSRKSRTFSF